MFNKQRFAILLGCLFTIAAVSKVVAKELSVSINGKPVIQIEAEKDRGFDRKEFERYMKKHGYNYEAHYMANRKLRERIYRLELAVMQLQESVYELQVADDYGQPERQFTCLLKLTHRGSFMGFGLTKLEAEGNARAKCEAKEGAFWCRDGKVSCDSN